MSGVLCVHRGPEFQAGGGVEGGRGGRREDPVA